MRLIPKRETMSGLRDLMAAGLGVKDFAWNAGDWVNSGLPGNRYSSSRSWGGDPGTSINYAALVGDIWSNSAVQACLNWLWQAWPESTPCIEETKAGAAKPVHVDDHPLLQLLLWPNSTYDDTVLWAGTILSFWVDGNAYWLVNRAKNGDAFEFEYVPHMQMCPKRYPDSKSIGADYFEMTRSGKPEEVPVGDVVHFRFGIDPWYTLKGLSGWASVRRHVYTDNAAVNYVANTMRRGGSPWSIWTAESADIVIPDLDATARTIESKTTGDNQGGVLVMDYGLKPNFPPGLEKQAIDSFHRIPETRICALAGIPPMAIGLASGLERSTFSNTEQAQVAAWQTILAVQRMMARQASQQLIRRPRDTNGKVSYFYQWEQANAKRDVWVAFDTSDVRALQPDLVAEWERIGKTYDRGLLTEDEARAEMGYDPMTPKQRAAQQAAKPAVVPVTIPATATANGNGTNGTGKQDRKYELSELTPVAQLPEEWASSAAARIEAELEAMHGADG
jgi:hypothetical protein